MDPEPSSLLILLLLLALSAVFSGAETALVSLTPAKIKAMHPKKRHSVRLIQRLKERPQKMLTTILLGNNVVNIAATSYATVLADAYFANNAITIVTAVMTGTILIFGEILPKAIANRYAASFARVVIYILLVVETIFFPLIWVLEKFISTLLRIFGSTNIQAVTEDELIAMVNIGAAEGSLDKHEQELIENVLDFDDTEVDAIMTPRVKIDAIEVNKTVKQAIEIALEKGRSRLPVYDEQIDNIVGVISVRYLLELQSDAANLGKTMKELTLTPAMKSPITRKINSLFNELRSKHLHMAFVYDEHGGLEGLVTMEDVLEELVGEILDEYDKEEEAELVQVDNNTIMVNGDVPSKMIEDALQLEIEGYEDNDQIAWVILDILNRYPNKGEKVQLTPNLQAVIEHITKVKKVIEKVKIQRV